MPTNLRHPAVLTTAAAVASTLLLALPGSAAAAASTCGTSGGLVDTATTASCVYSSPANTGLTDVFNAPSNAGLLTVVADGGNGGNGGSECAGGGGYGAQVDITGWQPGGSSLDVTVGGDGGSSCSGGGAGGYNGGGSGGTGYAGRGGGGGGGYSSVTLNGIDDVIAGGGGGGTNYGVGGGNGDGSGASGPCSDTGLSNLGGGAGDSESSNAGAGCVAPGGTSGTYYQGGTGGSEADDSGGGGGGGGNFGGGGGGASDQGSAGGGGGGQSYYLQNQTGSVVTNAGGQPAVAISWSVTGTSTSSQVDDGNGKHWGSNGTEYYGADVYDTASLGSLPQAGGSVTYTLTTGSTCSGTVEAQQTEAVTAGSVPNSSTTSGLDAGTYSYQASYSGDTAYGSSSTCESFAIAKTAQNVSFPATAVTYGQVDFSPASASSGEAVSYSGSSGGCSVIDSGAELAITGAGSCTATASQSGGTDLASASTQQTFTINQATLQVNATDDDIDYGQTAELAGDEVLVGFVNNDNSANSNITGQANCTVAPATPTAPGSYAGAISCAPGTLSAPNYKFVTGTSAGLTIEQADQTISFPTSAVTYGQSDFSPAVATSGLPVSYSNASGACTVVDSGAKLHIAGAGTCTATANQTGNTDYNPAFLPVTESFTVHKAVLTINASAETIVAGAGASPTYTLSGFANGESASSADVSGAASCAVASGVPTTTAGTYPGAIVCTTGTLSAANYSFTSGSAATLTVDASTSTGTGSTGTGSTGTGSTTPIKTAVASFTVETVRALSEGRLRVELRSSEAGSARITVTLGGGGRYAAASVALDGRSEWVTLKPSPKALRALTRSRHARAVVRLSAQFVPANGGATINYGPRSITIHER